MAAGDVAAARAAYQQAGELARRIGFPEALARAGLGLGLELSSVIVDPAEVGQLDTAAASGVVDSVEAGLLEEALVALGDTDSQLRARVLARLARALLATPQVDRRLQLSQEAVELARRLVTRRPWPRCYMTGTWPLGRPAAGVGRRAAGHGHRGGRSGRGDR